MKKFLFPQILFISSLLAQEASENKEASTVSPEESIRHRSLSLGHQEGIRTAQKQLKSEDINEEAYLEGFLLGLANKKLTLTPEEVRSAMTRLQEEITERELQTANENLAASSSTSAALSLMAVNSPGAINSAPIKSTSPKPSTASAPPSP